MDGELLLHEVKCRKCGEIVDRVDGEYGRHYVVANVLCIASKREIEEAVPEAETEEE